jgi:hypothetical protein
LIPSDLKNDKAWVALVEAQRVLNSCRADVIRSDRRTELLAAALVSDSNWDTSTALAFLRESPDDVPTLLLTLYRLSLSQAWVGAVLRVVDAAAQRVPGVESEFRRIVGSEIPHAVADDEYAAIANVLMNIGADDLLDQLAEQALSSGDPAVREIGAELRGDETAGEG